MKIQQNVSNYVEAYEQLRTELKWKVSDKEIIMMIASLYAIKQKEFQMERFISIADALKKEANIFSYMNSYLRYTTAAMFDVNFEKPEEQIPALFRLYDDFIKAKFQRGNFTYIAASVLLTKEIPPSDLKQLVSETKTIYDGMKKEHPFLTTASDYPLAALLALEKREAIIQHIETFYVKLNEYGFRKGNDLQFLSHILAISSDESVDTLVDRAIQVYDAFGEIGIKQKAAYYPVIGMLALLPSEALDMGAIAEVYEQLNNSRHFKWQKDMNILLAASFFISEKLDHTGVAETSIYTTLETILQAQQAVMIATVAGATAASTSSNSGN